MRRVPSAGSTPGARTSCAEALGSCTVSRTVADTGSMALAARSMRPHGHGSVGALLPTERIGRIVSRDARVATRAATLGPDSRTSTGTPSLLANLRPAALRALRTSRGRTASLGEPKTPLGALMLNTSYVVVVRYSMRRVS